MPTTTLFVGVDAELTSLSAISRAKNDTHYILEMEI